VNARIDALVLVEVCRHWGWRLAGQVFVRGLRGGSALYWLVVAIVMGAALGLLTADWAVVPR